MKRWAEIPLLILLSTATAAAQDDAALEENHCVTCHGNPDVWDEDMRHLLVTADDLAHDFHVQRGISCHDCHGGNANTFNLREAHAVEDGFRAIETPADVPGFCGHCHSDAEYMRQHQSLSSSDPVADFWNGVHGRHLKATNDETAATCLSCHTKHSIRTARDPESAVHANRLSQTCGACHTQQQEALLTDAHAGPREASQNAFPLPLNCSHCHGEDAHGMLAVTDPSSPVFVDNQVRTCGNCHEEGLNSYLASVHGHGLRESGLLVTAVCSSCHSAHAIYPAADERSLLHVERVEATCASCHRFIDERLQQSVHGGGTSSGDPTERASSGDDATRQPRCTDCHQGHDQPHPESVRFRLQLPHRCGNCHADQSEGYASSVHGELTELGYGPAAKCSDCHGGHDILAMDDPRSRLSPTNRLTTCRQCHPNAEQNFASFLPHANHRDAERYPVLNAVHMAMAALIFAVFGFFGVHTLLWFVRSVVHVSRHGRPRRLKDCQYAYVRFRPIHRVWHLVLIISFLGLALTGLPLRYSAQPWAQRLARALGGFGSTSVWHHVFGAVIVFYFTAHLAWLVMRMIQRRRRGRTWRVILFGWDSTAPNLRDGRDLVAMVRWFMGLGPKPTFERWTYWEKFDYWAVFWGVAVIGTSGFMLWMPNLFTRFLPGEALNVAHLIHSEEALLATGFIFAIHFLNTIRPEKFPMDMSMLTGLVSEEELREERPEFFQRMQREERLPELKTKVPPRRTLLLYALGGYMGLAVGMGLLAGILAASIGGSG